MHDFLLHLTESGHVSVTPFGPFADSPPFLADQAGTDPAAVLRRIDRQARLDFPGHAPALLLPAARWAAALLHRACQLLVCRDVSAADVATALADPCPAPRSPETHYSVDLVFCHLPDLLAAARRLAAGDPLVDALCRLARAWPLSSVGIPGLPAADLSEIETLVSHPGLRQLYVDRILQHQAVDRSSSPSVQAALRQTLGHHAGTLAPAFAPLLVPPPLPTLP